MSARWKSCGRGPTPISRGSGWSGADTTRYQVDEFLRVAADCTVGEDADTRVRPEFDVVLRGYDRNEVERYFERFLR
ncbi:MAG: hypothetical protein ACRDP6_42045 [Actinoallomurus sp.]